MRNDDEEAVAGGKEGRGERARGEARANFSARVTSRFIVGGLRHSPSLLAAAELVDAAERRETADAGVRTAYARTHARYAISLPPPPPPPLFLASFLPSCCRRRHNGKDNKR